MTRIAKKYLMPANKSASGVAGFVCGLLSLIFCSFFYMGLPLGILGISLGAKSVNLSGSRLGKAGIILGIIGLSLTCLIYLLALTLILFSYWF